MVASRVRPRGLAFLALLLVSTASPADFQAPPPLPVSGIADWEVFAGELASPRLKAGYRFYVDPRRGALFTVMRYRLRAEPGTPAPTEKFVWNQRPGDRIPLRCFEWIEATGAGSWRELGAGSPAYRQEMQTLLLVLSEQNRHARVPGGPESGP